MQIQMFDQYEFKGWESERFLAIAKVHKNVQGHNTRIVDVMSFFKSTDQIKCFQQWQETKVDNFKRCTRLYEVNDDPNNVHMIDLCYELADLKIDKDQMGYVIHEGVACGMGRKTTLSVSQLNLSKKSALKPLW